VDELIERKVDGGLCTLTLNRPEKHNALNSAVFAELNDHLYAIERQTEKIGCVVLRGAGRSFCAGADLSEIEDGSALIDLLTKPRILERLERLPQPVIAAVHGSCYTGGLELALAADFIIATASARFGDTHAKWGFVAAWGMTQRLPRRIGYPQAKRMMMSCKTMTAEAAAAIGLVDLCVADELFDAAVKDFASDILASSWFSNRETKRLMLETEGLSLRDGLAYEVFRHPGLAPDYLERVRSFSGVKKT
jgi:enoyl-CoA hydratase/carnithine racemase